MSRPSKLPVVFREQAVEMVKASGNAVAEVARDLSINDTGLGNSVKEDRVEREVPPDAALAQCPGYRGNLSGQAGRLTDRRSATGDG